VSDAPAPEPAKPSRFRRRCARVLVAAGVCALLLFLARGPILEAIPRALIEEDPEATADAIVVLAGDGGERVEHAVELWKRGRSRTKLLVLSGGPIYWQTSWSSLMAAHAVALGVPRENIVEQALSRTTKEDAKETVKLLLDRPDVRSIVLVTSAWHSRRAKKLFLKASAGKLEVISCPCPPPPAPDGWWHDDPQARAVATEVLKYLW
jgi:uncharacterized SAM-binding protein YcdF (DUF218 family)